MNKMNKSASYSRFVLWFMALLLGALAAGCGGGGDGGRDPILGGGGVGPIPGAPGDAIIPGGVCVVAAGPLIPTVTSSNPTNGNQSVTTSSGVAGSAKVITATFSLAMDPATINTTTFTLAPVGGAVLPGSVVGLDATSTIATLTTASALLPDTSYTAIVTGGATSAGGVAIACTYAWNFKTATPPAVGIDLGSAATFGIMATSATTSTGPTLINGDVSLDPGTSQGIPPAQVNGTIHVNDAESALAKTDLLSAYNFTKGLPPGTTLIDGADQGTLSPLAPGTYTSGSTMLISTPLVLDAGGNADAIWVFQIGSSLTTNTPNGNVLLANGAQAKNVFFVPTAAATIGVGTTFNGTILAGGDATGQTGATINGRILAGAIGAGTVALDGNTVNVPAP